MKQQQAGLEAERRWGRKEGQAAVAGWAASGLTKRAYCQKTGVPEHRLRYWVVRCGTDGELKSGKGADFFTVMAGGRVDEAKEAAEPSDSMEVQIGQDMTVRLPVKTDRKSFVETMRWLREAAQG